MDTKQAHRAGYDPIQVVKALGKNIKHIHYSDYGKSGDCLKFGFGEYDNLTLFRDLKDRGFDGSIVIELYKGSFSDARDLAENCRALEKFIEENIL